MRLPLVLAILLVASASSPSLGGKKKKKAKTGSIRGVVTTTFSTRTNNQSRANDEYCAAQTPQPTLVVNDDDQVKGVYVRIKNGSFPDETTPPAEPVVITQSRCEYAPLISHVVAGQTLEVHNDDPTFHNVRIVDTDQKTLTNKPQAKGAAPITTEAITGEGVVSLHCDVHPWMEAHAVISDHTHYTFTDAKGRFELRGLPPGTYTVEAWHPDLGWKATTVKLKKGKKVAKTKLHYDFDDCGGC